LKNRGGKERGRNSRARIIILSNLRGFWGKKRKKTRGGERTKKRKGKKKAANNFHFPRIYVTEGGWGSPTKEEGDSSNQANWGEKKKSHKREKKGKGKHDSAPPTLRPCRGKKAKGNKRIGSYVQARGKKSEQG